MRVRLTQRAFVNEGIHEAGEILDLPDHGADGKPTVLSEHMELVKEAVKPTVAPRPVPTFAKPPEPIKPPIPRSSPPDKAKPSSPETDKM